MISEDVDVVVIGAGLSGIGAGYHLQKRCPDHRYLILEGRPRLGGTWDLFRYPGIRSDSDMFTLGYAFRPWRQAKAIADGPAILKYIEDTAREFGIDQHIRYGHQVRRASWSESDACWTLEVVRSGASQPIAVRCKFLFVCGGYYDYERGYAPRFAGQEEFAGTIVHPQSWSDTTDYAGKKVVVIGSGATAVTLVPELARKAAHVTMLQRSPTYVVSRPAEDEWANWMRRHLPDRLAYGIARWMRILLGLYFYNLCRRDPERAKGMLIGGVKKALGPDFDVERHFMPRYNPWDQRLCLVPDGDLFKALKAGSVSVVTDQIDRFTRTGIRLKSGEELAADLIVTATGLNLKMLGGIELIVDDKRVDLSQTLSYKGVMYSDVPNLACAFGYTNASWTLKSDLTSEYVCRLINHMKQRGLHQCTPRRHGVLDGGVPWVDFSSGYFQRSLDIFPKQGNKAPWRSNQNYLRDILMFRFSRLDDGAMEFSNRGDASQRMASALVGGG